MTTTTTTTQTQAPAQAQQQAQAATRHTFTLTFPGDELAVLEVRGASTQDEAREIARAILPRCRYTVTDGDQSDDSAQYFYSWTCSEAQERDPRRRQITTQEDHV